MIADQLDSAKDIPVIELETNLSFILIGTSIVGPVWGNECPDLAAV